jgi:hypothetical protein
MHRNLHTAHAYGLLNLTESFQQPCKKQAKLKRTAPRSWPDPGRTIPQQNRIYMSSREGMVPYGKAWCTLATALFVCISKQCLVFALSESCVLHAVPSSHTTFAAHVDAQDLPCLIVFGCTSTTTTTTSTTSSTPAGATTKITTTVTTTSPANTTSTTIKTRTNTTYPYLA